MIVTDTRTVADFQKTTFCGHPRAYVVKALLANIQAGHADHACFWALEFLCSGLVHTLWMTFFEAAALHINRAQPLVFGYVASAYERYMPLESQYTVSNMTDIRNNIDIRNIICEVAGTLASCRKNKMPTLPSLKPAKDFDPIHLQEQLKAPSTLYGKIVLRPSDPAALTVAMNEFCYALRADVRDQAKCLYWMAWVFLFCREHKKSTKEALVFANRFDEFVSEAHGRHPVWIFWDAIRKQAQPRVHSILDTIYKMYCLRWSPTVAKERQSLLFAAIAIVCDGTSTDTTPVVGQTLVVSTLQQNIPNWIDAIVRTRTSML